MDTHLSFYMAITEVLRNLMILREFYKFYTSA